MKVTISTIPITLTTKYKLWISLINMFPTALNVKGLEKTHQSARQLNQEVQKRLP